MAINQNIKVTVDILVISKSEKRTEILLVKRKNEPFKGQWVFPGGFVDDGEDLETAAGRELEEETSVKSTALKQLRAYGDPHRDPRGHTVTIAFLCEVDKAKVKPRADSDAADVKWFSIDNLPELGFDHGKILQDAVKEWGREE